MLDDLFKHNEHLVQRSVECMTLLKHMLKPFKRTFISINAKTFFLKKVYLSEFLLLASPLITKLQSASVHMEVTAEACLLVTARTSDKRAPCKTHAHISKLSLFANNVFQISISNPYRIKRRKTLDLLFFGDNPKNWQNLSCRNHSFKKTPQSHLVSLPGNRLAIDLKGHSFGNCPKVSRAQITPLSFIADLRNYLMIREMYLFLTEFEVRTVS